MAGAQQLYKLPHAYSCQQACLTERKNPACIESDRQFLPQFRLDIIWRQTQCLVDLFWYCYLQISHPIRLYHNDLAGRRGF